MVAPAGSLAMIGSELRQARKGATVIADSCAEVWLVGVHHQFLLKMEFIPVNWRIHCVLSPQMCIILYQ